MDIKGFSGVTVMFYNLIEVRVKIHHVVHLQFLHFILYIFYMTHCKRYLTLTNDMHVEVVREKCTDVHNSLIVISEFIKMNYLQ